MIISLNPEGHAPARIRRMTESTTAGSGLPKARTSRVGRHLPTSGGLKNTLRLAREQRLEAVQIFVSNPQGLARATTTIPTLTLTAVK